MSTINTFRGHRRFASSTSIPISEPIPKLEGIVFPTLTPYPKPTPLPNPSPIPEREGIPEGFPGPEEPLGEPICDIRMREGCYVIGFTTNSGAYYRGTMRVDGTGRSATAATISGDLYRSWNAGASLLEVLSRSKPLRVASTSSFAAIPGEIAAEIASSFIGTRQRRIPIYPRQQYHSYLQVTEVQFANSPAPLLWPGCDLILTIDEYIYILPPAGTFNGAFPLVPSRTITLRLRPNPRQSVAHFEGRVYEAGVDQGSFSMRWVSPFFRKATLEIDTLEGALPPAAVPNPSGTGNEDFRTIFESAGWDLNVIYDQQNIPVPAGTVAAECWARPDLHALMAANRRATTDLDREWRLHLIVVPARMNCGRGRMYDQIGVHREGVSTFSHDGYPAGDSTHFGAAEGRLQHEVPRAYLRSAAHEVGHGFNQMHQELEDGADNSIMSTTPSVADVLEGAATGESGVFPDNIALSFNNHVRHHLIHMPDPLVRPGGMNFAGLDHGPIPEADNDRIFFDSNELDLELLQGKHRLKLGEPLPLAWKLLNNSKKPIPVPSDIRLEALLTQIWVVNPLGVSKGMPSFVIETDNATVQDMKSGRSLEADTLLFWSSNGFAFELPGKHTIEVRIRWNYAGVLYGVGASTEIWVDYPVSDADNKVASLLMNEEVGMYVCLGGGAPHLKEGVARIEEAMSKHAKHAACGCIGKLEERGGEQKKPDDG